jgi:L-lactate dehydrogenase complex protein LldF
MTTAGGTGGGIDGRTRFPAAAAEAVGNAQLRANMRRATSTIRGRRAAVVGELPDWAELRTAATAVKRRTLRHLDVYLEQLETVVTAAGGTVHWAADATAATAVVRDVVRRNGAREVVKVKSITTDEIGLNAALAADGVTAVETDLAELIVQLGHDRSSHFLVPAIHRNRAEIRDIFRREMPAELTTGLTDRPSELAAAARSYLRAAFLRAKVAVSGANFAVAETGSICVVESEGNGRMCLTLPEVLVSVVGIDKLVPTWRDLEVFLQLLPRSSTGERMNPYTSIWTGVHEGDGPREFHLVLLDNGRSRVLADTVGRQTLACIRCSACLNVCPVYERTGGHAYGSVYPGPIGAVVTPLLQGVEAAPALPYASSLCGACYDVCPVGIDIPTVLVHLRSEVVAAKREGHRMPSSAEDVAMRALAATFATRRRYEAAQRLGRAGSRVVARQGRVGPLPWPASAWTATRDAPVVAAQTFREWWRAR